MKNITEIEGPRIVVHFLLDAEAVGAGGLIAGGFILKDPVPFFVGTALGLAGGAAVYMRERFQKVGKDLDNRKKI